MDKLLKQLIPPVSASGHEDAIRKVIAELGKAYGEVSTDALGNLIIHRPGSERRIMIAAHMDSVGLIVTFLEEGGFARFANLGGLKPVYIVGQRVRFENGVYGVICQDSGVEPKDLTVEKLYVDTAGTKVSVGDTAVFCGEPIFQDGKVISPYLDNRLGCAVCLRALELLPETDNDVFFAFTVQEEVGLRGAKPAAYAIEPDLAIAVDICGVPDTPGSFKPNALTLSGGPVIKLMDARVLCHPTVVDLLKNAAKRMKMKTQLQVTKHGGTDAGAMFNTRGGVPSGVLAIPIRYTHNPNEIADLTVAEDCARLLAEAISE